MWCGLSANSECRSEMCCTSQYVARWKYRTQKIAKNLPSAHHRTTLLGYIIATKARVNNWKKILAKQQYLPHMSPQYGELRPTNSWDWLAGLGHPTKFQRVSRLAFVTAATSLTRGQPNFAGCLAVSWLVHYIYIFRGSCPVQNSLCVQVLLSPILAALVHGMPGAGISQTLQPCKRNGITELSQRAPPIFGRVAITLGIGPHSSIIYCFVNTWIAAFKQTSLRMLILTKKLNIASSTGLHAAVEFTSLLLFA